MRVFCVPNNNEGYPPARAVAGEAGYDAILTIYDDVNPPRPDLLRLCRCPLHTQFPAPFYTAYDPYKQLHRAMEMGGWVIDYCHCPMPERPIHPHKDCTLEQLEERFRTVCRLGGDDVWLAEPNEVVAYLTGKE